MEIIAVIYIDSHPSTPPTPTPKELWKIGELGASLDGTLNQGFGHDPFNFCSSELKIEMTMYRSVASISKTFFRF